MVMQKLNVLGCSRKVLMINKLARDFLIIFFLFVIWQLCFILGMSFLRIKVLKFFVLLVIGILYFLWVFIMDLLVKFLLCFVFLMFIRMIGLILLFMISLDRIRSFYIIICLIIMNFVCFFRLCLKWVSYESLGVGQ